MLYRSVILTNLFAVRLALVM